MTKIHITTLGCSKNEVDSDVLRGQLKLNRFDLEDNPQESDVIIINTCGFIESAKDESIQAILEAVDLKKADPNKKVFVAGCLSARYATELKTELPDVDRFFKTEDYQNIVSSLNKKIQLDPNTFFTARDISSSAHFAYLKISEGCNHSCHFCAIPAMRGKHRSRSLENILEEAQYLVSNGAKELILIAQDATFYGLDIYKKQKLAELLTLLETDSGARWIRVMYSYPLSFPMDVLTVMKQSDIICHYIDMPLQHVSNRMLKLMNRGTQKEYTMKVLRRLREEIPEIAIRTTMIVGHPGETNADHQEMLDFIQEFKFSRLGVFTYSEEDNTASAGMDKKVSLATAIKRMNAVMETQRQISESHNLAQIGQIKEVIIDSYDMASNVFIGRSKSDAPEIDNDVIIHADKSVHIGDIIHAQIENYSEYELYGKKVE